MAYVSPFVPAEWIAAHGLRPLRLLPECAPQACGQGVCPFAAAFTTACTAAPEGSSDWDAVVIAPTCDQMRRAGERVLRAGVAAFAMHVPAAWQTPHARPAYIEELLRLGRFLTSLGGTAPDDHHLAAVMRRHDEQRHSAPSRRSTGDGLPLALVGGPVLRADRFIYDVIDQSGGRVVLDATESGERTRPRPFDPTRLAEAPLLELADAYFSIPDVFRRPNDAMADYLLAEFDRRGVRGVVMVRYLWCDLWHAEFAHLRERGGVPMVALDLTGGRDGAGCDGAVERVRVRVRSLVETVR